MRNKQGLQANQVSVLVYYLITLGVTIWVMNGQESLYLLLLLVAAWGLPMVPRLFCHVFGLPKLDAAEIAFDAFILCSVVFGSILGGYQKIPYYDKLLHSVSGFLLAVVGALVYYWKKPGRTIEAADAPLASLFAGMFAVASAALWEIYEFALSFWGIDPQQTARTGVGDTMWDIIVCTIGGLLTAAACYRYIKWNGKKRYGLMMVLFRNVYEVTFAESSIEHQSPKESPN